jgi:hypothetical protein
MVTSDSNIYQAKKRFAEQLCLYFYLKKGYSVFIANIRLDWVCFI